MCFYILHKYLPYVSVSKKSEEKIDPGQGLDPGQWGSGLGPAMTEPDLEG